MDFSTFTKTTVRCWARTHDGQTFWIDEDSTILDEIFDLEEHNGYLPECGIHRHYLSDVKLHKEDNYLLIPKPILKNTWTWTSLPYTTRQRQVWKPPPTLVGAVVMDVFEIDQGVQFYQGLIEVVPLSTFGGREKWWYTLGTTKERWLKLGCSVEKGSLYSGDVRTQMA